MTFDAEVTQIVVRAGLVVAAVLAVMLLAFLPRTDQRRVLSGAAVCGAVLCAAGWTVWPTGWDALPAAPALWWDLIDFGLFLMLTAICTRLLIGMIAAEKSDQFTGIEQRDES